MFYDTGKPACSDDCGPSCDCGKYVEIWNNVFMEFYKGKDGKYTKLNRINTMDDLKNFVKSLTTGTVNQQTVAISNSFASDKNFYDVATWAFDTLDVTVGVTKTEIYVSSEASAYHIHAFENTYHGKHHGNKAYDAKKTLLPSGNARK